MARARIYHLDQVLNKVGKLQSEEMLREYEEKCKFYGNKRKNIIMA